MPPKFKRHLNDEEVTGSIRSERRNLLEEDSDEEEDFFLRGPTGPRFGGQNDKIRQYDQENMVLDLDTRTKTTKKCGLGFGLEDQGHENKVLNSTVKLSWS
uniref:Vesicle-associated membrane protein 4-like n=1 Tax=Sinocyclocheilus rhinocerous TaxID=307959 RepID=A0A673K996_9TELE